MNSRISNNHRKFAFQNTMVSIVEQSITNVPKIIAFLSLIMTSHWWNIKDSNLGPTGYEPVALTN